MSRGDIVALRECGSLLAVWAVDGEAGWLRTFGLAFGVMIAKPQAAVIAVECAVSIDWVGYEVN